MSDHINSDGCALIILFVEAQNEPQHMGNRDRQKGLLRQTWMSIDEQIIQRQRFDQAVKPIVHQLHIVAVLEDTSDFIGLDTRGAALDHQSQH